MKRKTRLVHKGRNPLLHGGSVNPPIYQTSTVIHPTLESYHAAERGKAYYEESQGGNALDFSYGTAGTPTTFALQEALRDLEGGEACVITSSGLSAITIALLSFLSAGDHLLMVDTVYGPTRRFCNKVLKRLNIDTTFYAPNIGAEISELIQDNTKIIFMEAPGSLTFEMQDVPAIVKVAKSKNIITMLDNSWATPIYFNPIEHGVDISLQAITKYIGGHSDIIMGAIITKGDDVTNKILSYYRNFGETAEPSSCYLALRGLRSLSARMERHQRSVFTILRWLKERPEVAKILYPALEGSPDYKRWKELFSGAASLFSVVLDKKYTQEQLSNMIDGMKYFGIGASWGGYESLVLDFDPSSIRTATKWEETGSCVRFYIGLEDTDDLIEDMGNAFDRL